MTEIKGYPVQAQPGLRVNTGNRYLHFNPQTNEISIYYLVFIKGHGKYVWEHSDAYQEFQNEHWRKYRADMRESRIARRLEKSKSKKGL